MNRIDVRLSIPTSPGNHTLVWVRALSIPIKYLMLRSNCSDTYVSHYRLPVCVIFLSIVVPYAVFLPSVFSSPLYFGTFLCLSPRFSLLIARLCLRVSIY